MQYFTKRTTDNTQNDFSLPPADSDSKWSGKLQVGAEQLITVPSVSSGASSSSSTSQYLAIFKPEPAKTIWYALNKTATVPGAVGAFGDVEMTMPLEGRSFFAGDVIHVITGDATAFLSISFYQI